MTCTVECVSRDPRRVYEAEWQVGGWDVEPLWLHSSLNKAWASQMPIPDDAWDQWAWNHLSSVISTFHREVILNAKRRMEIESYRAIGAHPYEGSQVWVCAGGTFPDADIAEFVALAMSYDQTGDAFGAELKRWAAWLRSVRAGGLFGIRLRFSFTPTKSKPNYTNAREFAYTLSLGHERATQ